MGKENCDTQPAKGATNMTKQAIINLCKKNNLYVTPKLNDILYLHYQGYQKIECLEEYTELKCLWLECNALTEISGLENQSKLRSLFVQNNFIRKIENLHYCPQIDTLQLSHNYIKTIENCDSSVLPVLNTLNLSHNSLSTYDSIKTLIECKTVSILDLSHNRIDDILIVKILAEMPELRVLTLIGNPVVNEIPSYRKTLIIECKNLTYLDSRPVFDRERACAEAWKRGGYEEEKKERTKWSNMERRKVLNSVRAIMKLRKKDGIDDNNSDKLCSSSDDECHCEETANSKDTFQEVRTDNDIDHHIEMADQKECKSEKTQTV